jgi:hypothetical protein
MNSEYSSCWWLEWDYISRIVASWIHVAGFVFGQTFDDWLTELGISDDDKKTIHDYVNQLGLTGKMELENHAKKWLKTILESED